MRGCVLLPSHPAWERQCLYASLCLYEASAELCTGHAGEISFPWLHLPTTLRSICLHWHLALPHCTHLADAGNEAVEAGPRNVRERAAALDEGNLCGIVALWSGALCSVAWCGALRRIRAARVRSMRRRPPKMVCHNQAALSQACACMS